MAPAAPIDFAATKRAVDADVSAAVRAGKNLDILAIVKAHTTDVDGYLSWARSQPTTPFTQTTAQDAVSKLQAAKFSSLGSVLALTEALQDCKPIPLVSDKDTQFFVVFRPAALTLVPRAGSSGAAHPYFLALSQTKAAPAAPKPAATPLAPPRVVYPLGAIVKRDVRPASALSAEERAELGKKADKVESRPLVDTNYAVVVDVVASTHPVWLIYNRNPYNIIAGEPMPADPAKEAGVFPSITSNFDAAQAVASLKDWSVTPAKPTLADFQKLVEQTRSNGAVSASTVLATDVTKAFPAGGSGAAPAAA